MTSPRAPILLLHGGWGGAWCWSKVVPALVCAGHPVLAPDLPGGGLDARSPPASPRQGRAWRNALATLSLADYASIAMESTVVLHERFGPVVVAGHSINGVLLHYLGERLSGIIRRLVYVAAVGPAPGRTVAMDTVEPPWSASLFGELLTADPESAGVLRIEPTSIDARYRDTLRRCWFADVPADTAVAATRMLSSETPAVLLGERSVLTAARWGSLPRTWIRTLRDASIPASGQDANIADLDAAFCARRFDVTSLDSGHMPFLSVPEELAKQILLAARREDVEAA